MKASQYLAVLCVLVALVLPGRADEKPGKGKKNEKETAQKAGKHDERQFTEHESEQINTYCRQYSRQESKRQRPIPPGLAKKMARGGKLPPGWEKKCVPGEIMPVEVYQECHPLPRELTLKLPVPPIGTVTVAIEGRIVRILEKTREILDVLNVPLPF